MIPLTAGPSGAAGLTGASRPCAPSAVEQHARGELVVPGAVAEERLIGARALVVELRVLLPGEAEAAVDLDGVAGDAIQIYGGLGFAWEQDPQLYYKRARSNEALLGDGAWHYELAARVLLDG